MEPHQIIDRRRKEKGITLRAFADLLGRSHPWAQMVCDGRQVPFISMARRIADALGLPRAERRMLLEGVARIRLQRSERLTDEEAAVMATAAGGL